MSIAGATLILVAAVSIYAALLARLRRVEKASDEPVWWHGYARDGVNLVGFALLFCGYVVAGDSGPLAFVLASSVALWVYVADWLFGRALALRAHFVFTSLAGLALGLAALSVPALAAAAHRAVLTTLPQ